MTRSDQPALRVFLSHQYRSEVINQYFYDLLTSKLDVLFRVDRAVDPATNKRLGTNVTLLELEMNDADAFVGIFPFRAGAPGKPTQHEAREDSKYFRLEMDMAIRARKPGLIFYDERLEGVFSFPHFFHVNDFDAVEIAASGAKPNEPNVLKRIADFQGELSYLQAYRASTRRSNWRNRVGILLPASGITKNQRDVILDLLENFGWQCFFLPADSLDLKFLAQVEDLRWVLVEIGIDCQLDALVGYLHGRGIPTLRICRSTKYSTVSLVETYLLKGVEVGYARDILYWKDVRSLRKGLELRLQRLRIGMETIASKDQASRYFHEAQRLPHSVFLSYAGDDEDTAKPYGDKLRERFKKVFDYRDGRSLLTGKPWAPQLEETLAEASLAVLMLSPAYLESKPCQRESELMANHRFNGTQHVITIKLRNAPDGTPIKLPGYLGEDQYLRVWENDHDPQRVVDKLVSDFRELLRETKSV